MQLLTFTVYDQLFVQEEKREEEKEHLMIDSDSRWCTAHDSKTKIASRRPYPTRHSQVSIPTFQRKIFGYTFFFALRNSLAYVLHESCQALGLVMDTGMGRKALASANISFAC
jgi:hypothetical protein